MSRITAIQVPVGERELISEAEAIGFVCLESYSTFKRNYIDCGLSFYRQVGQTKFYRKADILDFIDKNGLHPNRIEDSRLGYGMDMAIKLQEKRLENLKAARDKKRALKAKRAKIKAS